jgi:hypothetical protein
VRAHRSAMVIACPQASRFPTFGCVIVGVRTHPKGFRVGSVIKKRRKRMSKKKHRKLLKRTRVQRRRLGK